MQFYALGALMGDYEGARYLHFFAMAALVLFVIVHVVMVALVPRTFPTMFTGRARIARDVIETRESETLPITIHASSDAMKRLFGMRTASRTSRARRWRSWSGGCSWGGA